MQDQNSFYQINRYLDKMRIAIKFAYDGRKFHGYARQPDLKTVEGEIIKVLVSQGFIKNPKESIFRSASRTDKGASALGNVFAFNTDTSKKRILQKLSDEFTDIIVYGINNVRLDFNPRYAKQRNYRYYLKNKGFDMKKIISTVSLFTGTHNFTNFARIEEGKNHERTIDNIVVSENKQFFTIDFYAQTFLWHQIRRIISAIEKVVAGKISKGQLLDALNKPELKFDCGVSPAEPLILKNIIYSFNFEYNACFNQLKIFEDKIIEDI